MTAEDVARLDIAAPAGEIGGEVVGQRVLTGMGGCGAREDEQEGCQERQEADAWHAAIVVPAAVTCLSRTVPGVDAIS